MLTPREIALAYDLYMTARWRGDESLADSFAGWLERHWIADAPPEPAARPDAVSVLGAAGSGVRWYADHGALFGYVAGRPGGCYKMSDVGIMPEIQRPAFGASSPNEAAADTRGRA